MQNQQFCFFDMPNLKFSTKLSEPSGNNEISTQKFCRVFLFWYRQRDSEPSSNRVVLWQNKTDTHRVSVLFWRRQRDSNPRGVAPKRFSRPPRYDRFDMPPYGFNRGIVSYFAGVVKAFGVLFFA